MKKAFIGVLVLFSLILSGCGGIVGTIETPGDAVQVGSDSTKVYYEITPAKCADYLAKDCLVVAVDSVPSMILPNTDLFITYQTVKDNMNQFPSDKNTPILVYCTSGDYSHIAAEALVENGYTYVMELKGGSFDYSMQGYALAPANSNKS